MYYYILYYLYSILIIYKHPVPTTQEKTTHGHHQRVNTKIRLIIFFAAKMEKLYTASKNKTGS